MNIPRFAIDNYQLTLTVFVFLFVVGISAYLGMPRAEDPAINVPSTIVTAIYPGASPEDMESQVADPIEEVINELEDVKQIVTNIEDGLSVTEVEFYHGVDPKEKFDEVESKVNGIRDELPSELYRLDFIRPTTTTVAIYQLALLSETASYSELQQEAERIKRKIEKVSGVRKVEIEAYPEQEVRIALNPVKMSQMGISLDNVEQAIASNNANIPGGSVKVSNKLFNVKTSGAYATIDQIRNTVVGAYQGQIIYLKNVAAVFMDYEDERYTARYNGQRSIVMTVQQKEGFNIFAVAGPIREQLEDWKLPDQIELAYVFDQSEGVKDRIDGFSNNLLQGVVLVGLIIFLVLGIRSASLVMLSIPFSILIGLWIVDIFDLGLQQMSIAGLIVALGLLVDNSIAIIENIERYLSQGYSTKEAAIEGTRQLVAPMFSATLTTVLAFVPIIVMPDTTGEFIRALPVSVIATLSGSLLIAITLNPFISSRLLKAKSPEQKQSTLAFRLLKRFVEGPYRRTLDLAFRFKWLTIAFAIGSFVGALMLFPYVGLSFFPKAEKPQFRITVNLPKGQNLDATDEVVRYIESTLDSKEDIDYYFSNIGHGNPRIYYNISPKSFSNNYAELFVSLKTYNVKAFYALLEDLRLEFGNYAKARIEIREFVQGPAAEAPIAIKIYGNQLDQLQDYARQVEQIVSGHPGTINVNNPLENTNTNLMFDINRDKAMMLGVPIYQLDRTIRTYVNGSNLATFRDQDAEEYNIVMRYDFEEQFQLSDFDKIEVQSVTEQAIPLKQLANISFEETPTLISHLNTDRVASILADVRDGYTLDALVADFTQQMDQLEWAEGYSYEFKGDLEKRQESFGGLGMASIMALILILGVLIVQFRSFTQPLIIFSALPLAIIGSILMLLITGVSFSFTAFVGLVSLIGIAINNSIVLVDFANKQLEAGSTVTEAAKKAGEVRFIPIVLTTMTTILGLLPLTLAGGSMWAPMGWTIIGGLLTSTFFVLLLIPILYQLLTSAPKPLEAVDTL
ncbi:MAG: efflux RND transporter permease subunit [Bacteroidota bacterium]